MKGHFIIAGNFLVIIKDGKIYEDLVSSDKLKLPTRAHPGHGFDEAMLATGRYSLEPPLFASRKRTPKAMPKADEFRKVTASKSFAIRTIQSNRYQLRLGGCQSRSTGAIAFRWLFYRSFGESFTQHLFL